MRWIHLETCLFLYCLEHFLQMQKSLFLLWNTAAVFFFKPLYRMLSHSGCTSTWTLPFLTVSLMTGSADRVRYNTTTISHSRCLRSCSQQSMQFSLLSSGAKVVSVFGEFPKLFLGNSGASSCYMCIYSVHTPFRIISSSMLCLQKTSFF